VHSAVLHTTSQFQPLAVAEKGLEKIIGSSPTQVSSRKIYISPSTEDKGCSLFFDDGGVDVLSRTPTSSSPIGSGANTAVAAYPGASAATAAFSVPSSAVAGNSHGAVTAAAAANLLRAFSAAADSPVVGSGGVIAEEMHNDSSTLTLPQVLDYDDFPLLQDSILVSSVKTNKFRNYLQTSLPKIKTTSGGLNLMAKSFSPSPPQYSYEDIVAYGGIPDSSKSAIRSSGRIRAQSNADQPQLEKVMQLTQQRLATGSSSDPKLSILNIPDLTIIDRAGPSKRGTRARKKVVLEKPIVRRSSRIRKIRTFES
jgi:hypothetical protein